MRAILLGDVHGNWAAANETVHLALGATGPADIVIQLGDLGDGWPTSKGLDRWKPDFDLPIFVIDGNHENFYALEQGNTNPHLTWMKRGQVFSYGYKQNAMCMGGATSPDVKMRTIGINWWPQESITMQDFHRAMQWPIEVPIDIMFAHERADVFPIPARWKLPIFAGEPGKSDRYALGLLCDVYKPKWYFHGHWHHMDINKFDDTVVVACPNIDNNNLWWTMFDGHTVKTNWWKQNVIRYDYV